MNSDAQLAGQVAARDAGPGAGEMRSGHMRGFVTLVRECGGDPRAILAAHEIDPLTFADPDSYVSCSAAVNAMEYCGRHFNDPLFGARLGAQQSADVFGIAAALGRAAPTVREGLGRIVDTLPLIHSAEGALQLAVGERQAEHRWTGDGLFATNLQGNYQALILQLKLLETLGGRAFRPDHVLLCADVPASHRDELEAWVGCRVAGRQDRNAIAFPVEVLDWPVMTSNRLLFALLNVYLDSLRHDARACLPGKVAAYIRSSLALGTCSLERCARALGMSRRMLQWRLQAEGLCFSEMIEKERVALCRGLLTDSDLSMVEISGLLGYAEQSSFGRACRRWFGAAPGELRRERARAN